MVQFSLYPPGLPHDSRPHAVGYLISRKFLFHRVPNHLPPQPERNVRRMATEVRVRYGLGVRPGLLARPDAVEEVLRVIGQREARLRGRPEQRTKIVRDFDLAAVTGFDPALFSDEPHRIRP